MSEWISVEDRLPEIILHEGATTAGISEPVLVKVSDEDIDWMDAPCPVTVWRLFRGGRGDLNSYYWDGTPYNGSGPNVTHWMPLPEPPKEQDDDN